MWKFFLFTLKIDTSIIILSELGLRYYMDYKNELRELFNIFNETNKAYNELASKVGLSYNQMVILYYLQSHYNVTQKNIVNDMLIPKQTINTILNNWINAGYISFENKLTKKNKIILLTEFGKKELELKITFVMDKEAIILERLGDVTKSLVLSNLNYLKIMKEVIKNEE